jgi:hypothetical protein
MTPEQKLEILRAVASSRLLAPEALVGLDARFAEQPQRKGEVNISASSLLESEMISVT